MSDMKKPAMARHCRPFVSAQQPPVYSQNPVGLAQTYRVRLFAIRRLQIFPLFYVGVPGHQALQDFVGWRFAIIGQSAQHQQQVFIGLHTIGLGRFPPANIQWRWTPLP